MTSETRNTHKSPSEQRDLLEVPVWHQKYDYDCSVAATGMVLKYWNDEIDFDDLVTTLSPYVNARERHLQGIGMFLVKRGYDVLFCHHDSNVIDKHSDSTVGDSLTRLQQRLKSLNRRNSTLFRRTKLSLDVAYIQSGGSYSNRIPTLALIDSHLAAGVPVIICVNQQTWESDPNNKANHYVVVVGQGENKYWINDPSSRHDSPYGVSKERLLMAWYKTGAYTLIARPEHFRRLAGGVDKTELPFMREMREQKALHKSHTNKSLPLFGLN